jgi:RNA polymerase sigma-70 factor (family 1)
LVPSKLNNEHEIIHEVAKGNEKAFRELFNHYWDFIYSTAYMLTKSSLLSEEIVQDVFLKVWLKKEHLPSIKKFDSFLFIVARNHIYNVLRKKTLDQNFVEHLEQYFLEISELPHDIISLKETNQIIEKAIKNLPDQQKKVFTFSRYHGFNYSKIAEEMGISKLTVKSHMTKALRFIKNYLEKYSESLLLIKCLVTINIL